MKYIGLVWLLAVSMCLGLPVGSEVGEGRSLDLENAALRLQIKALQEDQGKKDYERLNTQFNQLRDASRQFLARHHAMKAAYEQLQAQVNDPRPVQAQALELRRALRQASGELEKATRQLRAREHQIAEQTRTSAGLLARKDQQIEQLKVEAKKLVALQDSYVARIEALKEQALAAHLVPKDQDQYVDLETFLSHLKQMESQKPVVDKPGKSTERDQVRMPVSTGNAQVVLK